MIKQNFNRTTITTIENQNDIVGKLTSIEDIESNFDLNFVFSKPIYLFRKTQNFADFIKTELNNRTHFINNNENLVSFLTPCFSVYLDWMYDEINDAKLHLKNNKSFSKFNYFIYNNFKKDSFLFKFFIHSPDLYKSFSFLSEKSKDFNSFKAFFKETDSVFFDDNFKKEIKYKVFKTDIQLNQHFYLLTLNNFNDTLKNKSFFTLKKFSVSKVFYSSCFHNNNHYILPNAIISSDDNSHFNLRIVGQPNDDFSSCFLGIKDYNGRIFSTKKEALSFIEKQKINILN